MEKEGLIVNILLRSYSEADWESTRCFIVSQWGQAHPMADRSLFTWQFRGFGRAREEIRPILLFIDGVLAGFRGLIPGLYQVPSVKGVEILPGGSLAMWMLRKEFRGLGLGRLMHAEAQRLCPVLSGAGSNPETSVPIYLKNGFQFLEAMNRYLAVLDPRACRDLFGSQAAAIPPAPGKSASSLGPSKPDPDTLAEIWEHSAFRAGFFSLYRNAEFWKWRILESPGFRYEIFLDPEGAGFAVARVEPLFSGAERIPLQACVLRIIDLVPSAISAWNGSEDAPFARFLGRCLVWAREAAGCIAADFHCASGVFGATLKRVGFASERAFTQGDVPPLPRLFNGSAAAGRPINALFRAPGVYPFERVYMVKSDNDMDRPRRLDENGQVLY